MGIIKMYFFFYHSYCLRLLLFVCIDVESNSGPRFDNRVRVLYSNIRGLEANLDELAVAGSGYDALVCTESKVSDRRHLPEQQSKKHISRRNSRACEKLTSHTP